VNRSGCSIVPKRSFQPARPELSAASGEVMRVVFKEAGIVLERKRKLHLLAQGTVWMRRSGSSMLSRGRVRGERTGEELPSVSSQITCCGVVLSNRFGHLEGGDELAWRADLLPLGSVCR
jgi:hypothetical protein